MTRKTYGRKDIGRIELEGGWFTGESWAIEAHAGYWPDARRLCLMYLQVAKLCVSVGINLGPKAADVAEWGRQFEAMAKREPVEPKAEVAQATDSLDYVDWEKVPEGYDWVAVNADQEVYAWPQEPLVGGLSQLFPDKWNFPVTIGPEVSAAIIGPLPPWRDSLRRRPGSEAKS